MTVLYKKRTMRKRTFRKRRPVFAKRRMGMRQKRGVLRGSAGQATSYNTMGTMYAAKRNNRRAGKRAKGFKNKVLQALGTIGLGKQSYFNTTSVRIATSGNGTQNFGAVNTQNSYNDINQIFTQISSYTGEVSNTFRCTITSYHAEIMMKNQTQASAIVDMYKVIPREDTDLVPTLAWANGCSDQGSATMYTLWGATPFLIQNFTTQYKILEKKRYILPPGGSIMVNKGDKRKYAIVDERFQNASTNSLFKGWTTQWFAVVRGEPINDSTTKTLVSSTQIAVDFCIAEQYQYEYVRDNIYRSNSSNSFGSVATASSLVQGPSVQSVSIIQA